MTLLPSRSSRTVLWGARRGDVQYASRDFWRRNIPIGVERLQVTSYRYFDVGDRLDYLTVRPPKRAGRNALPFGPRKRGVTVEVAGLERDEFGNRWIGVRTPAWPS